MSLLLFGTMLAAYEIHGRANGFRPRRLDTAQLWTSVRATVGEQGRDETVIIGSSRAVCGIDTQVLAAEMNISSPKMLAISGASPLPVLEDLADDPRFIGTLICEVSPNYFFSLERTHAFVQYWRKGPQMMWEDFEAALARPLHENFAFRAHDMSIRGLGKALLIAGEAKPAGAFVREDRSVDMSYPPSLLEHELSMRLKRYSSGAGSPKVDTANRVIDRVVAAVEKLRRRGVAVLFVRMPSHPMLLEIEERSTPRASHWDLLITRTGCPGINYEDYAELAGFSCPDGSHMDAQDKPVFTVALARIVQKIGGLWTKAGL